MQLPLAYSDPHTYLAQKCFHQSIKYRPPHLLPTEPDHRVTFSLVGSTADPTSPLLVVINGLGGHRLFAAMLAGIAEQYGIRVLTFDRPSAGGTTPVPLPHRIPSSREALLAILSHPTLDLPSSFHILSHSNGIVYTLNTLLNLPTRFKVISVTFTSPWVPAWISGSIPFQAARVIPARLTSRLGNLLTGVMKVGNVALWSSGIVTSSFKFSSGLFIRGSDSDSDEGDQEDEEGGIGRDSTNSTTPPNSNESPLSLISQQQDLSQSPKNREQRRLPSSTSTSTSPREAAKSLSKFKRKNAKRKPEERTFGGMFYSSKTEELGLSYVLLEGVDALGIEALVALKKSLDEGGTPTEREGGTVAKKDLWGWFGDDEIPEDEDEIVNLGFGKLASRIREEEEVGVGGGQTRFRVFYGTSDGMVPAKGREHLRKCLVEKTGLVKEEDWKEIKGVGHDVVLGLECVMEDILEAVKRAGQV
ncbi:hypothetical protein T439DRAFT_328491 [Meredithblackwellia eburnea MCA 4105]